MTCLTLHAEIFPRKVIKSLLSCLGCFPSVSQFMSAFWSSKKIFSLLTRHLLRNSFLFFYINQVGLDQVKLGWVRSGQVGLDQVKLGWVRSGQVRSGQVRSGQVRSHPSRGTVRGTSNQRLFCLLSHPPLLLDSCSTSS